MGIEYYKLFTSRAVVTLFEMAPIRSCVFYPFFSSPEQDQSELPLNPGVSCICRFLVCVHSAGRTGKTCTTLYSCLLRMVLYAVLHFSLVIVSPGGYLSAMKLGMVVSH